LDYNNNAGSSIRVRNMWVLVTRSHLIDITELSACTYIMTLFCASFQHVILCAF